MLMILTQLQRMQAKSPINETFHDIPHRMDQLHLLFFGQVKTVNVFSVWRDVLKGHIYAFSPWTGGFQGMMC